MRTDQFPKPFFRSARNACFVQFRGKQIKFHVDRDEASRLDHEMMVKLPEERAAETVKPSSYLVAVVLES